MTTLTGLPPLPQVQLPATFRHLGPVDIAPVIERIAQIPDTVWDHEDRLKENSFKVFGSTRHIVLRFTDGNRDPRIVHDNSGWLFWKNLLLPIMEQVVTHYSHRKPAFSKAMFARLAAGGEIGSHRDGAGSNLLSHKVHVPLVTNPGAIMVVDGEERHLEVGRAYELNNIVKHGARNTGKSDRIHFIFEHFDAAPQAG